MELNVRMKVYLGLIDNNKGVGGRPGNMCEQLAPDLKTESNPKQLTINAVLRNKHGQFSGHQIKFRSL